MVQDDSLFGGLTLGLIVLALSLLPSLACLVHLWAFRRAPTAQKIAWTFKLLLPILGPLLYASSFGGPPSAHGGGHHSSIDVV